MNRLPPRTAGVAVLALGAATGCQFEENRPLPSTSTATATAVPASGSVPLSTATTTARPTFSNALRTYVPAPSSVIEPAALSQPPSSPFVSNPTYPDCVHPGVRQECTAGWCRLPPGCYVYGSPESEPGRIDSREQQGPVTISRGFEIQQYETTIEDWEAAGLSILKIVNPPCEEPDCPALLMSWFEVALYANLLSLAHEPPLPACYVLEDCEYAEFGYACRKVGMTTESVYDCPGYRLPTRAEWQYAARGGTTTSYYSGNIAITEQDEQLGCPEDPNLNPIAWYCYNSWTETRPYGDSHPVGLKWANGWGLYDMLGNVDELLHEPDHARSPKFPATDPFGEIGIAEDGRPFCGGQSIGWPTLLRVASGLQASPTLGATSTGFRLARTLPE